MKLKTGNVYLEGLVDFDKCIPALSDWFAERTAEIPKPPPSLALGCPIWGEKFINRFLDFCLPSLLAEKNLEILKDAGRLILFTTKKDKEQLRLGLLTAKKAGLESEIHFIPDHLVGMMEENPINRYWLLGTVQNLCLKIARSQGMGFHMLMPDHLYAEEYFPNLFRLSQKYEAIAQTAISGDIEPCLREISAYRKGDAISIPDHALGDIVFRNMHRQNVPFLMNGRDLAVNMPDSHFMFWVGKNSLHIYCCHMNAAYLSPRLVHFAPVRLPNALDTELPAFMPCTVYVPELSDKMTFTELSDGEKRATNGSVPIAQWMLRCLMTTHFLPQYERFFAMKSAMPIESQESYMEDDEISLAHKNLHTALLACKDHVKQAYDEVQGELEAA